MYDCYMTNYTKVCKEGRAAVKVSLAFYKGKCLLYIIRNVIFHSRYHMAHAKGLVKGAVTHNVKLKTKLFNDVLKLQAIFAVLFVRNIVVRHLCVDQMPIPAIHIVVGYDLLDHEHVHVSLGKPNYSISDMLK